MTFSEGIPNASESTPEEVLKWAWRTYGESAVFTSSFGAEDMVIMDMLSKTGAKISVATLDTGRLPEETYRVMEEASSKYGIQIMTYFPDYAQVEGMVRENGMNLFYRSAENRKLCCRIRKVDPLNRLLKDRKAWITGLRADQTPNRRNSRTVELDEQRGIVKINPILNWSSEDVWNYIRENGVPYNELHDKGFPSIGCEPCTRAIKPGEDERAGRWWWESDNKECGLHVNEGSEPAVTTDMKLGGSSARKGGS